MSFILDTDHCIAILRARLDVGQHVAPTTPLFVAAITVGELKDALRRVGTPIAQPDPHIASIAVHHGPPLAAHSQRHFARVPELKLLDWL